MKLSLKKKMTKQAFWKKTSFSNFSLQVGYYVWRESGNLECAYELFMDEYDDWVDDCKDIAFKAKTIFEEHIKQ